MNTTVQANKKYELGHDWRPFSFFRALPLLRGLPLFLPGIVEGSENSRDIGISSLSWFLTALARNLQMREITTFIELNSKSMKLSDQHFDGYASQDIFQARC